MAAVGLATQHDDVIKWKHFPRYLPFVWGIHRSPVNSPHKGQWRGTLVFPLICAWINGWVNNRKAGDLRRHHAHYDVIVMKEPKDQRSWCCYVLVLPGIFRSQERRVKTPCSHRSCFSCDIFKKVFLSVNIEPRQYLSMWCIFNQHQACTSLMAGSISFT